MTWIFRIIPFPFLLLIGGLIAGAAACVHVNYEIDKRKAREAGVPPSIAASELGEVRGFPWYDEVSVRVQTHDDLVFTYWEDTLNGGIEAPVVFFLDPSHEGPVREVVVAIAFDHFEAEDMGAYLDSVRLDDGPVGAVFELAGVPPFLPYVTREEVEWAASDLGLTLAPNFLYLDPYFRGRDTRIQARPELTYAAGGVSMLLIWLSIVAAIIKRRWHREAEALHTSGVVAKKGFVAMILGGLKVLFGGGEEGDII